MERNLNLNLNLGVGTGSVPGVFLADGKQEIGVTVTGKGSSGQATGDQIASSIEGYNSKNPDKKLGLSYKDDKFTISNSSHLSKEDLSSLIFQDKKYYRWHPIIEGKNKEGNWQIGLSSSGRELEGLTSKPLLPTTVTITGGVVNDARVKTGAVNKIGVTVTGKGSSGQATGDQIASSIEGYNSKNPDKKLGLSYKDDKFTISNSSHLSKEDLSSLIFQDKKYYRWHPIIEGKNKEGNWQIGLSSSGRELEGLTSKPLPVSQDTPKAKEVPQGTVIIAKPTDEISHLQTYGMVSCVGLTLYHKDSKTGALAHIDGTGKAEDLDKVIARFKELGIDPKTLSANIYGGDNTNDGSKDTFKAIQDVLAKNNIPVKNALVGDGQNPSTMQLDLSTGEVSTYQENIPFKNNPKNIEVLLQLSSISLYSQKLRVEEVLK